MKEAFRRHLPIWVVLSSLFLIAVLVAPIFFDSDTLHENEAADEAENDTAFQLVLKAAGTGFEAPADIVSTRQEGDRRLYIVEQGGKVKILENGETAGRPLLDISSQVINEGEQGLLGMVFSTDLAARPYIYVNYVRPMSGGRETVIARYNVNEDQTEANESSEKIILKVNQPYANHNAGDLAFGPDGYLYVPLGDGGSAGDPQNNAQNTNSLLGKILRIDVSGGDPYAIPEGNPFAGEDNTRPEIWSLGWRNPWRLSFDSSGRMWVGDVGQNSFEEINMEEPGRGGLNYGWRCFEGTEVFDNASTCPEPSTLVNPVATYEHVGQRCSGSITGGFVYEGQSFEPLKGYYWAADYCRGRVYRLDTQSEEAELEVALETELGISSFGEDSEGELYLADRNGGGIYQLVLEPEAVNE